MSTQTKNEVLAKLRSRYAHAGPIYKSKLLDQAVELFGLHRKSAIRALRRTPCPPGAPVLLGRPCEYRADQPLPLLKPIWLAAQQPCGKRLVAALPDGLPFYEQEHRRLSRDTREQVLSASAATLERLLHPLRAQYRRHPGGTRPGTLLRQPIPLATTPWDSTQPGYLELDTVALCGGSLDGDFVWMLDSVDFCTQWVEARAVWNKGWFNTLEQLRDIEARLPFALRGIDNDNGGALLNGHVLRYCQERQQPVQMSRSRPYHKDDNAHIEQKNWTRIRQGFGYHRYDNPAVVALLNERTGGPWRELLNFFCPTLQRRRKERVGAQVRRVYGAAQTPYQRLLEHPAVSRQKKTELRQHRARLNPFAWHRQLEKRLKEILATARRRN